METKCSNMHDDEYTPSQLDEYMEVDKSMPNPYDQFFTEEQLVLLREYAALFMKLWKG